MKKLFLILTAFLIIFIINSSFNTAKDKSKILTYKLKKGDSFTMHVVLNYDYEKTSVWDESKATININLDKTYEVLNKINDSLYEVKVTFSNCSSKGNNKITILNADKKPVNTTIDNFNNIEKGFMNLNGKSYTLMMTDKGKETKESGLDEIMAELKNIFSNTKILYNFENEQTTLSKYRVFYTDKSLLKDQTWIMRMSEMPGIDICDIDISVKDLKDDKVFLTGSNESKRNKDVAEKGATVPDYVLKSTLNVSCQINKITGIPDEINYTYDYKDITKESKRIDKEHETTILPASFIKHFKLSIKRIK